MQRAIAAARAASTKTPSHSFEREGGADPVQIASSPSRARRERRAATVETAEPDAARRDVERAREHGPAIGCCAARRERHLETSLRDARCQRFRADCARTLVHSGAERDKVVTMCGKSRSLSNL